jgi:hypothetical protein
MEVTRQETVAKMVSVGIRLLPLNAVTSSLYSCRCNFPFDWPAALEKVPTVFAIDTSPLLVTFSTAMALW